MKCSIPSGFSEFAFAATVLQASAAQIGINVQIEQLPFVQAIEAIKSNKSNCFVLGNANLSPTESDPVFCGTLSDGRLLQFRQLLKPAARCARPGNPDGHGSSEAL